jgi:hypothetical protein
VDEKKYQYYGICSFKLEEQSHKKSCEAVYYCCIHYKSLIYGMWQHFKQIGFGILFEDLK